MSILTAFHLDDRATHVREVQGVDIGRLVSTTPGGGTHTLSAHNPDELDRYAHQIHSLAESMRLARIASVRVAS